MSLLRRQAATYSQLHALVEAGLGPDDLVKKMERRARSPKQKKLFEEAHENLRTNMPLHEALEPIFGRLPLHHRKVLEVGDRTGMLGIVSKQLMEDTERQIQRRNNLFGSLAYPLFLLSMAILIIPVPSLVLVGPGAYYGQLWPLIFPIGFLVGFGFWPRIMARFPELDQSMKTIVGALPVVGSTFRKFEWERYLRSLSLCVSSGLPMYDILKLSRETLGDKELRKQAFMLWREVDNGGDLADGLHKHMRMPENVLDMLETGEMTGKLEEMAVKGAEILAEEGEREMGRTSRIVGWVVYFSIIVGIVMQIVQFYTSYFNQVAEML